MPDRDKIISIQIEGTEVDHGHVRLEDFLSQLQSFEDVLSQTARILASPDKPQVYFRIVEASHKSPMRLALEPVPLTKEDADRSYAIADKLLSTTEAIESGRLEKDIDLHALRSFRKMTSGLAEGRIGQLTVSGGKNRKVLITNSFVKSLDELVLRKEIETLPESHEEGSVKGRLVGLKLWGKKTIYIEPNIGPLRVECYFDNPDVEYRASKSVKRFVHAFGILHYSEGAKHPLKIDIKEIEILPEEEELPKMRDLHGIAPELTDGKTVEEFLESTKFDW